MPDRYFVTPREDEFDEMQTSLFETCPLTKLFNARNFESKNKQVTLSRAAPKVMKAHGASRNRSLFKKFD